MAILDHRGMPVEESVLRREVATVSTRKGVRNPFDEIIAHGMTPRQVISFIQAAGQGDHSTYLQFAAEMERRDPHYYSVLHVRKMAVAQLPRKVIAPSEDPAEVALAEMLQGVVNADGFTFVLMNVLDSLGKGFSVNEIIWDTTLNDGRLWLPKRIKWRNPKFFTPDLETGEDWKLKTDASLEGEPLAPFKYIVHEPALSSGLALAGGLARVCIAMHMFKSFTIRDWAAFAEVFGMPIRIGKYSNEANPEDVETLRKAIRDIGSDAAAVLPTGMEIIFERAQSGIPGGDDFFHTFAQFLNGEMSKAVLGQTMTTEDGASLSQAQIHNEVRKEIRDADAESLQAVINRDVIRPIVDLNFGVRPRAEDYPRLIIDVEEPEDLLSLAQSLSVFIDRGLEVEQSVIWDKFGLPEPEAGAKLLQPEKVIAAEAMPDPVETPPPSDEANLTGMAMVRQIVAAAERHTNMRTFKHNLKAILENARND